MVGFVKLELIVSGFGAADFLCAVCAASRPRGPSPRCLAQRRQPPSRFMAVLLPSLTVVILCRDAEATLDVAVESVLQADLAELELLLLDDGAVDATADISAEWARREARVRVERCTGEHTITRMAVGREARVCVERCDEALLFSVIRKA